MLRVQVDACLYRSIEGRARSIPAAIGAANHAFGGQCDQQLVTAFAITLEPGLPRFDGMQRRIECDVPMDNVVIENLDQRWQVALCYRPDEGLCHETSRHRL